MPDLKDKINNQFNIQTEFLFDTKKVEYELILELKKLKNVKNNNYNIIALSLSEIIKKLSIAILYNKKLSPFLNQFLKAFGRIESDYFNKKNNYTISHLHKFISNKEINTDLFKDLKF